MVRIVLSPVFLLLFVYDKMIWGLIVFSIAAITDGIDGFFARKLNQKSKFGEFIDPMADKVMVGFAIIALFVKFGFPFWGLWMLARDVVSLCGSFLIHSKRKENWKPNIIGKLTTFMQIITVIAFVIGYSFREIILIVGILFSLITAVSYAYRGIKMIRKK